MHFTYVAQNIKCSKGNFEMLMELCRVQTLLLEFIILHILNENTIGFNWDYKHQKSIFFH